MLHTAYRIPLVVDQYVRDSTTVQPTNLPKYLCS